MDAPLSLYLACFAAADGTRPTSALVPGADGAFPDHARPEEPAEPSVTLTAVELEARLAAARRSAGEEATSAHETALADAALAYAALAAEAMAAARREWVASEGKGIAAALDAVAVLRELLAAKVAEVLRPLLAQAFAERACLALGAAVEQILDDPDQPCLTVSGPTDLLEAIRAARAATREGEQAIAYVVADTPDVVVAARATRVETRLAAALAALAAPHAVADTEARS